MDEISHKLEYYPTDKKSVLILEAQKIMALERPEKYFASKGFSEYLASKNKCQVKQNPHYQMLKDLCLKYVPNEHIDDKSLPFLPKGYDI